MSIKGYKRAFSGIEPSKDLHDSLLEAVLKEESGMKRTDNSINRRNNKNSRHSAGYTSRIRPRLAAALAAVMILGVSMTAAAAFDFNEIFQDFFKRETTEGNSGVDPAAVPLEAGDDFLESAGNVIHEETAANGLKLTLRGTVGDGNALYAALDVETEDGSPFSQEQENSVNSYRFEEVMLEGEGIAGDGLDRCYCGLERIDDGSVPGKATFLLSEIFENDLKGKTIKMTLQNLMTESNEIIDLGMDKSIWELMQEFEPLEICGTEGNGGLQIGMSTSEADAEGNMVHHENFMVEKTDKRAAFSSVYPEARISNLGVWRGKYEENLIVNLEFGGALDWDLTNQKSLIVLDRQTGQILSDGGNGVAIGNGAEEDYFPGKENQADIVGDDYISCRYCFNGIGEAQARRGVFALGGDGSYEELFGGTWTLEFMVDYEDTMKTWTLEEKVQVENLAVKEVQISPVSAIVKFDMLSEGDVDFEDVILNLKNGGQVKWDAMSWDSDAEESDSCRILWKSVVDLEEIEGITVNGIEIKL